MNKILNNLLIISSCLISFSVQAQQPAVSKPPIDSNAINSWQKVSSRNTAISEDGKFIVYFTEYIANGIQTLVVQETNSSWKKQFPGATDPLFAADGRLLLFRMADSLCLLNPGTDHIDYIPNVQQFSHPQLDPGEWIAYLLKNEEKQLVIRNIINNKQWQYDYVEDFTFDKKGNALLLKTKDPASGEKLEWVDLHKNNTVQVWPKTNNRETASLGGYQFDEQGRQVVFMINQSEGPSIWYYQPGMPAPSLKVDQHTPGIDTPLLLANITPHFSYNGQYILFQLQEPNKPPVPNPAKLHIWSYLDTVLHAQKDYQKAPEQFDASIGIHDNKVHQLIHHPEVIETYFFPGDHIVVRENHSYYAGGRDMFWLKEKSKYWLMSLKDGSRQLLPTTGITTYMGFSPNNNYLVYFDYDTASHIPPAYYSYNLQSHKIIKISDGIPTRLNEYDAFLQDSTRRWWAAGTIGRAGVAWRQDDRELLVYDNYYDIWQMDPDGRLTPQCITHHLAQTQQIQFHLAQDGEELHPFLTYRSEDSLLLIAFNTKNKYSSLLWIKPGQITPPDMSGLQPCSLELLNNETSKKNKTWLLSRESFDQAPSLVITKDFRHYTPLTDLQPQRSVNWLTAELVNWTDAEGIAHQGILYKPEDFDATRSYPMIINYYDLMSDNLYKYPEIEYISDAHLNIPWLVGRGYIYFTPDIHTSMGKQGEGALQAVTSGALYLCKQHAYINPKKMGIAGHSMAGGFTNYIITHTNLFAAGFEGAGASNYVSSALQLAGPGGYEEGSRLPWTEYLRGYSIWDKPDVWIKESPILNIHKMETPLLMFHCKDDDAMPFDQAIELFISMRRLGKRVWLLEYEKGNHNLALPEQKKDLTLRVVQFFDHYLKDAPAPMWMTREIPQQERGVTEGLKYDTEIKTPPVGKMEL